MSGSVLSVASRALVDACVRLGLRGEPLLATAGLSSESVRDPEARLPVDRVDALWRAAYAASGDPALALHAAQALRPGDYRVLHYLAAHCRTVGEAYRRILPYFALVDRRMRLSVHEESEGLWCLRFVVPGSPLVPRPPAEFTLAALYLQGRAATRLEWTPARVDFQFTRPPEAGEHRRAFAAPIRYGQPHTQLCLHQETWELPLPTADSVLAGILERHAAGLLADVPQDDGILARVRAVASDELGAGRAPTLGSVARHLGLGARTLQRRLANEGTNLAGLVDEVRAGAAESLLDDPGLGLAEIAWMLGFSDQSAFTRAYRRWTGRTPAQTRRARQTREVR